MRIVVTSPEVFGTLLPRPTLWHACFSSGSFSSTGCHGSGCIAEELKRGGHHFQTLLVGGLEHGFYNFPILSIYIGNVIIPTDELIVFRGVGQPPTRFGQSLVQSLLTLGVQVRLFMSIRVPSGRRTTAGGRVSGAKRNLVGNLSERCLKTGFQPDGTRKWCVYLAL